jgi:phosphoribosyl-ATP pyrophosphohydrolase/phosphoribosyl-AMP cyclohydrolase
MHGIDELKFDSDGLLPAIVQDQRSGAVLMLAYMNKESLEKTLESGETVFWSRSRNAFWHKGETSGNTQAVRSVQYDCDADALLITVDQRGKACHTGSLSCFFNSLVAASETVREEDLGQTLQSLAQTLHDRKRDMPEESYTTYLFTSGLDKILKKIGEESAETIIAAKNRNAKEIAQETADLLYHLLVLLEEVGVPLVDVSRVLSERRGATPKKTLSDAASR